MLDSATTDSHPLVDIGDLVASLRERFGEVDLERIRAAHAYGADAHRGQTRKSGEPYIHHPLAVAKFLGELGMDCDTVVAAILHDVIEDTQASKVALEERFGAEVAELVDGVTKLTQMKFRSRAEAQAENFRKMILAMSEDIRVILIKLADRLHNMRTLGAVGRDKQIRIARETGEIYVPIAHRLGLECIRRELAELCLARLHPWRHRVLAHAVEAAARQREAGTTRLVEQLQARLEHQSIRAEVSSRVRDLAGLYERMKLEGHSLSEAVDAYALQIIVASTEDCYRVLGVVHGLFKPVPGRFKDYIAIPKSNGYQSLHTILFGPRGTPIDIQIRTHQMHRVAELGIAAHLTERSGKDGAGQAPARVREWLNSLLEMQQQAGNSVEFLEHVKVDLFPDEVYAFTPRGKILRLPRRATVVDFAYAVHTDLGNTCVAARVDGRFATLSTQVLSGQTVEIITARDARPKPNWLNFVVTAKARANIRHVLKQQRFDEAVELGQRMLEQALPDRDAFEPALTAYLARAGYGSVEALYADLGLGNKLASVLANQLRGPSADDAEVLVLEEGRAAPLVQHRSGDQSGRTPLILDGSEAMVISYARCCHPVPQDPVAGFLSAERGVVVHREGCKNLVEGQRLYPAKRIDADWAHHPRGEFLAEIRVDARNNPGVLASVAGSIGGFGVNIANISLEDRDGLTKTLTFLIGVRDTGQLDDVMRRIERLTDILSVVRTENF